MDENIIAKTLNRVLVITNFMPSSVDFGHNELNHIGQCLHRPFPTKVIKLNKKGKRGKIVVSSFKLINRATTHHYKYKYSIN